MMTTPRSGRAAPAHTANSAHLVHSAHRRLTRGFATAATVAAVVVMSVVGCDASTALGPGADVRALAAAVRRWEATAPPSYEYTLQKLCFCAFETPLRVTVRDGVVEEVFAALAYALDLPAANFSASYDPTWGFPTEASIDHLAQAIDDEVAYRLSAFVAIP